MSSFYRQMSTGYHTAAVDLVHSDETLIQRALDLLARWVRYACERQIEAFAG